MASSGGDDARTVDDERLLDWIKRRYNLSEKLDGGDQIFGPFSIKRKPPLHVRYEAYSMTWELVTLADNSLRDYTRRRETIVRLADEHRDNMPRGEFVKLLILAAIDAGITNRTSLLETLDLAANREAIQQSLDSNGDTDGISKPFSEAYLKGQLAKHQGPRAADHLWYVDEAKVYHLH